MFLVFINTSHKSVCGVWGMCRKNNKYKKDQFITGSY